MNPGGPSDAAARLAKRLERRAAHHIEPTISPEVPTWWCENLAPYRIFGDDLLSFRPASMRGFSRPVRLLDGAEVAAHSRAGITDIPIASIDAPSALVWTESWEPYRVYACPFRGGSGREELADSLVVFLDALVPCTLCILTHRGRHRGIELVGDDRLLVDDGEQIEEKRFSSDQDIGSFVANFLAESIGAGYQVVTCPADMVPLIESYASTVARSREIPAEVRALVAISHLHASEALELSESTRGAGEGEESLEERLEELIDQAGRFLERHGHGWSITGRPPRALAVRFGNWLLEQPSVEDVYADDDALMDAFLWEPS